MAYHASVVEPGPSPMVGRMAEMKKKKARPMKPNLSVHADVDMMEGPDNEDPMKWKRERRDRIKKECAAMEQHLKNWNALEVASRAKKDLEANLAMRKADLMRVEAELGRGRK